MHVSRALEINADLDWQGDAAEPLEVADRLVAAAQVALPVTGVGLAWMLKNAPGLLVAATDDRARRLEELQFTCGEGPCTRSAATGRPELVDDLTLTGSSWPAYTAGALEVGVAAVFAFPLRLNHVTIGVLDLYRDRPGPLPGPDVVEAQAFATVASWVLVSLSPALADHLAPGDAPDRLASRFEVHQASGVLAVQLSLPVGDALNVLRARAFADGRPIAELAHEIVTQARLVNP